MKLIITVLLGLFTGVLHAQEPKQITLQKVKENHKIDSLFESVRSKIDRSEKYFCFRIRGSSNDFTFDLFQITSDSSKISFPHWKLDDFNFFEWRGYTIFVVEAENPFHLFEKIDCRKSFSVGEEREDIASQIEKLYNGTFKYREGKFARYDIVTY